MVSTTLFYRPSKNYWTSLSMILPFLMSYSLSCIVLIQTKIQSLYDHCWQTHKRIVRGVFAFIHLTGDPLFGIISHNLENQSSFSIHLHEPRLLFSLFKCFSTVWFHPNPRFTNTPLHVPLLQADQRSLCFPQIKWLFPC